jgi:hypothetical protein
MTRTLVTAEVTAADITAGERYSVTGSHPVALAVRRALGLHARQIPPYIGVGQDWFSIKVHGSFYESHDLPEGAGEWIRAYDHGEHVRPFTFTFATAWPVPAWAGRS